jgi:putative oxidoreductase
MVLETTPFTDYALVFLRIIIAVILFSSGKGHVQNPKERAKSLGLSINVTLFLGIAEMLSAISIAFGIFAQIGAVIIIGAMLGAIYMKIFKWKTGFYAEEGFGWHYDLLILLATSVVFTTAGGLLVIV